MALGKNNQDNSNLFVLKIKTKDANLKNVDPFFQVFSKNSEGKWVDNETNPSTLSGKITKLAHKVSDFNGEKIPSVQLIISDKANNENYLLDLKYNMLNRGIFNSLLSLDSLDNLIKISLYTNKKGYATASVRSNDESLNWKFSLDQLPEPKVVQFKGKEMRDFSELDTFFQNELSKWFDSVSGGVSSHSVPKSEVDHSADVDSAGTDDEALF